MIVCCFQQSKLKGPITKFTTKIAVSHKSSNCFAQQQEKKITQKMSTFFNMQVVSYMWKRISFHQVLFLCSKVLFTSVPLFEIYSPKYLNCLFPRKIRAYGSATAMKLIFDIRGIRSNTMV